MLQEGFDLFGPLPLSPILAYGWTKLVAFYLLKSSRAINNKAKAKKKPRPGLLRARVGIGEKEILGSHAMTTSTSRGTSSGTLKGKGRLPAPLPWSGGNVWGMPCPPLWNACYHKAMV